MGQRRRQMSQKKGFGPKVGRRPPERARPLSRAEQVLAICRQDTTFAPALMGGQQVWVGRCIHCRGKLLVHADGTTPPNTTIEHIRPQHRGGTAALSNLALACRRCNHLKGSRIDPLPLDDPRVEKTFKHLQAERERRLPAVGPIPHGPRSGCEW